MDIDAFFRQQLDNIEDEEMEHEQLLAGMATAVLLIGAIEAQRLRAERRKLNRLYLCRPQLLPLPRVATPWQVLHKSRSDRAFITTMGFDVATFNLILAAGFDVAWNTTPIP